MSTDGTAAATVPSRASVEARIKELEATRDTKIKAINDGFTQKVADQKKVLMDKLAEDTKGLKEQREADKKSVRENHRKATRTWNQILKAFDAEEGKKPVDPAAAATNAATATAEGAVEAAAEATSAPAVTA